MKVKQILAWALFISSIQIVYAANMNMGTGSSGGGMVVVCKTPQSETIELLDVYEANNNSKIITIPPSGSLEIDYNRAYKNLMALKAGSPVPASEELNKYIQAHLRGALNLVQWSDEAELRSTQDQGQIALLPSNCQLKQVAIFIDSTHSMIVNKMLWNKMSSLSQAALMLHEEFYFDFRQLGDKTSEVTRSYVAQVIAKLGSHSAFENTNGYKTQCYARNNSIPRIGATDFFLDVRDIGSGVQQLTLQLTSLLGRNLLTKTMAQMFVKNAQVSPSFMDGITYNQSEEIKIDSSIDTLLGEGYSVRLKLSPSEITKLQFSKDNNFLGEVEIRSCNAIN